MATVERITLECDLCGTEENVESHEIKLDQKAPRVVDACPPCWKPVGDVLENVMNAGTSKKIAARRVAATRTQPRAQVTAATSVKVQKQAKSTTAPKNTRPKSAAKKTAKKATAKKTTSRA